MTCNTTITHSEDHAGMLNGPVRIEKEWADSCNIRELHPGNEVL